MITATITLNYTEEQIKKYATFAGWTPVDENDTSYVEFAKERLLFIIKKDFKAMNHPAIEQAIQNAQAQVLQAVEQAVDAGLEVTIE